MASQTGPFKVLQSNIHSILSTVCVGLAYAPSITRTMSFIITWFNYNDAFLNNTMPDFEKQKKIIDILNQKGAILPCPRCGKASFSVLDEYITLAIQKDLSNIIIGGFSIPAAVAICNNCGYIRYPVGSEISTFSHASFIVSPL